MAFSAADCDAGEGQRGSTDDIQCCLMAVVH